MTIKKLLKHLKSVKICVIGDCKSKVKLQIEELQWPVCQKHYDTYHSNLEEGMGFVMAVSPQMWRESLINIRHHGKIK